MNREGVGYTFALEASVRLKQVEPLLDRLYEILVVDANVFGPAVGERVDGTGVDIVVTAYGKSRLEAQDLAVAAVECGLRAAGVDRSRVGVNVFVRLAEP